MAVILLALHAAGAKYTAIAIHGHEEAAKKHADIGFHDGGDVTSRRLPRLL
jgi:hypothetical protein